MQPTPAAADIAEKAHAHIDWEKTAPVAPVVPALLTYCAGRHGDRELLVFDDERLTYGEAAERSTHLAARLLRSGIGKGSRVALLLPNGPEFVVSWLAIVRIGAVAVPVSTLSTGVELARILNDAGTSLLIATDRYLNADFIGRLEETLELGSSATAVSSARVPFLRSVWLWRGSVSWASPIVVSPAEPSGQELVGAVEQLVAPSDAITIIYTSGSTSAPKGVLHTHGTFMRSSRRWAASMIYREGDRHFSVSPMFWVGGLITSLLTMMQVGATLVGSSRSDGSVLDVIEREKCTSLQVWPHLARKIEGDPTFASRNFSAMRGGSVPSVVPAEQRVPNAAPFGWAMGMTETAGPHTLAMGQLSEEYRGAMGLLAPGMEHRIVDVDSGVVVPDGMQGELHVRGDTLMSGYLGRESSEVFDQDGWFRTGDLCTVRDGYIFFHGRRDSTFKTAGANVAPAEVEAALRTIPGIAEAHVLGVPDEERGAIVGAIIVPHPGASLDRDAVLAAVRPLLSPYKIPRRLLIVDAIPATGTNKLDRPRAIEWLRTRG